ncbi:hypothetical protein FOA52_010632 [Chlamydomonas sp. UWO 241]|nr:hypothetical protein FOA52_010632 [Chlamydomonas sp. UWO 241]
MSKSSKGPSGIIWSEPISSFPYSQGFVPIVISWFSSPVISCIVAAANFLFNRRMVLRRDNSTKLAFMVLPFLVTLTVFINVLFVIVKGAGKTLEWPDSKSAWVAAVAAIGSGVLVAAIVVPLLMRRLHFYMEAKKVPHQTRHQDQGAARAVAQPAQKGLAVLKEGKAMAMLQEVRGRLHLGPHKSEIAGDDPQVAHSAPPPGRHTHPSSADAPGSGCVVVGCVDGVDGVDGVGATGGSDTSNTTSPAALEGSDSGRQIAAEHGAIGGAKGSSGGGGKGGRGGNQDVEKATVVTGLYDNMFSKESVSSGNIATRGWHAACTKVKAAVMTVTGVFTYGLSQDVHAGLEDDERVVRMHQAAEIFDPETEHVYKYLQVFSACCVSFAHGSNDVANAVGPFAGIWYVYNNYTVATDDAAVPKWILAMGGAGIVLGLSTYGYKIIRVMGVKMAKISPSRGYCAELAVALTVSCASAIGLPVSTTHCIVGAEIGVGMCEDIIRGANWTLFARTFVSWVFTLAIAGIFSAALFAQGAYAPSIYQASQLHKVQKYMVLVSNSSWAAQNASNYRGASITGNFDTGLNATIANQTKYLGIFSNPGTGFVYPKDYISLLDRALVSQDTHSLLAVSYETWAADFTPTLVSAPARTAASVSPPYVQSEAMQTAIDYSRFDNDR